jgi:hypothetical protein
LVVPGTCEKTEKPGRREMHTEGPGIWREALKNLENEICTLEGLEYAQKPDKRGY